MLNQQFYLDSPRFILFLWSYFAIHIICVAYDCERFSWMYVCVMCVCVYCVSESKFFRFVFVFLSFARLNNHFVYVCCSRCSTKCKFRIHSIRFDSILPLQFNVWKMQHTEKNGSHRMRITQAKNNEKTTKNYSTKWSYKNVYEFPIPIWIFL